MNFLQPAMLWALPIIAVPIVIHLINQRRYRTIEWAAMNFLLAANRMSRGYARIRQWLILALRTLAIAGLIFAISRPLASGWLKLASPGSIDTTLILLDRSPSMQQQGTRSGETKLDAVLEQLTQSLAVLKSNRWVVIDSANQKPIEIESPEQLQTLLETGPTSVSADMPGMLQVAYDYLRENRPSRTEVWLCSDLRRHDWDPDSARWQGLRDAFLESPFPVRFHLLAFADAAGANRSIRVTGAETAESVAGRQLRLSLKVEQTNPTDETVEIPVRLELNGAISEIPVELVGSEVELQNYLIELPADQTGGWGRVSLPADANLDDNEFYFVFDDPPALKTIIVADSQEEVRSLQLAAGISATIGRPAGVEVLTADQLAGADWSEVSLLLWQAAVPVGDDAQIVNDLLKRGGQVVFFPPEATDGDSFAGLSWGPWQERSPGTSVANWKQDQGLLADVNSGAALPVGELTISRYRKIEGEFTTLATLNEGEPLLCVALTNERNVYFCATKPGVANSSLDRNGVVLYVMIQRALQTGAESLGAARQLIAGASDVIADEQWRRLSESERSLSTTFHQHAGAYQADDKWLAINRAQAEDVAVTVEDDQVAGLFGELEFDRVDVSVGGDSSLFREIWPTFLLMMMLALIGESALCLPRRAPEVEVKMPFAKEAT